MNYLRYYIAKIVVLTLSALPAVAGAKGTCTNDAGDPVICNPLEVDSVRGLLERIVDVVTTLSIPVIVVAIIYAGFLFVTAGGNTDQIEKARKTAMYVAVGAGIILGAQLITDVLINTAENLGVERLDDGNLNN